MAGSAECCGPAARIAGAAAAAVCDGEDPLGEDSPMVLQPDPGPSGGEGDVVVSRDVEMEGGILTGREEAGNLEGTQKDKETLIGNVAGGGGRKPGTQPPVAWAELFKGGRSSFVGGSAISQAELEDVYPMIEGMVVIPANELAVARRAWSSAVIGKFLGHGVGLELMSKVLSSKWNTKGKVEIIPMDRGFFTFRFCEASDVRKVLSGGPWVVAGQTLAVESWRPNFCAATDSISRTPVWIRLPNLPVEYWSPKMIRSIAVAAGRPIALDDYTCALARGKFARVCVEIELRNSLCPGVFIGEEGRRLWQPFEYENVSLLCFSCGVVGHVAAECGVKKVGPAVLGKKAADGKTAADDVAQSEGVGPWTLVDRRKRGGPGSGGQRRSEPGRGGHGEGAGRVPHVREGGAARGAELARQQVRVGIPSNFSNARFAGKMAGLQSGSSAGGMRMGVDRLRKGDGKTELTGKRRVQGGGGGGATGWKTFGGSMEGRERLGQPGTKEWPAGLMQRGGREAAMSVSAASVAGAGRSEEAPVLSFPLGSLSREGTSAGTEAMLVSEQGAVGAGEGDGAGVVAEGGGFVGLGEVCREGLEDAALSGMGANVGVARGPFDAKLLVGSQGGAGGGSLGMGAPNTNFAFAAGGSLGPRGGGRSMQPTRGERRGPISSPPSWPGGGSARTVRHFSIEPGGSSGQHGATVARLDKAMLQITNEAIFTGMNGAKRTRTGGAEDEDCQGSLA